MKENMETMMSESEQYLLHTYNRYPVVLDHGNGVYLYDTNGKKYLDFAAGIAVCALGYGNQEFNESLKSQIDKILHVSNYFYTEPLGKAAKVLVEATGLKKAFLCNSGTEANEGAIKLARKYALQKGYEGRTEIISMNHAFHGRSMGALAVTGTAKYREPFEPLIGNVKFAEYNDLESVKEILSERTCAIIVEALQGEGGIYEAKPEFIKGLRKICDEHDLILICDEIQCGMGRTGKMFAYQKYDILPDVVTMAKGIGNGITVGAFAVSEKAQIGLEAGDHGTTFGGNPLAATAVCTTFKQFQKMNLVEHVKEVGEYLTEQLENLVVNKENALARRGAGLMQGLECSMPVTEVIQQALKEGVIFVGAGANVIRFLPPLIIEKEHVDEMIQVLKEIL